MIISHLLSIALTSQEINLRDLPPTPAIIETIKNGDLRSYNDLILKTQRVVTQFSKLSDKEKNVFLRKWVATVKQPHTKLQIHSTSFPLKVSSELNSIDVSKVDVLLVVWKRRTIFHREDLMRTLYSANQNRRSSFKPIQVSTLSKDLKFAASFGVNTFRKDRYSFQPPFVVRSEWFFRWVENGLNPSQLKKLDIASLYTKKPDNQ